MKLRDFQIPSKDRLVTALRAHGAGVDASDTGIGKTHVACATCKELGLRPAVAPCGQFATALGACLLAAEEVGRPGIGPAGRRI